MEKIYFKDYDSGIIIEDSKSKLIVINPNADNTLNYLTENIEALKGSVKNLNKKDTTDKKDKDKTFKNESEDYDKHISKRLDILNLGMYSLFNISKDEPSIKEIENFKSDIPKWAGIWVKEEDRSFILNIINKTSKKQYIIDYYGFLVSTKKENKNQGSAILSEVIDSILNSEKVVIVGRSDKWYEYGQLKEKITKKYFTNENPGITIGGKFSNQIIILDNSRDADLSLVLSHELIHGLRGIEGHKNRVEEELYACDLENKIRKELKKKEKDISNLENAYENYGKEYRDDSNSVPFEYGEAYFGTIRLNDPSSSLNVRSGPSTSDDIAGSLSHGDRVTILGKINNWYSITYNNITGYVREDFVTLGSLLEAHNGTIKLNDPSSSLNIRSGPSTSDEVIGSVGHNSSVKLLSKVNDWYMIYQAFTWCLKHIKQYY